MSIRYRLVGPFGEFANSLAAHYADIDLTPASWRDKLHPLRLLLLKTMGAQEKAENIPPQLAGETMRSVLSGQPYPIAEFMYARALAKVAPRAGARVEGPQAFIRPAVGDADRNSVRSICLECSYSPIRQSVHA